MLLLLSFVCAKRHNRPEHCYYFTLNYIKSTIIAVMKKRLSSEKRTHNEYERCDINLC